jgi:DMSO/TMAO reductase YedYZ molybdopterin-dependent catalytic subunit
MKKSTKVALVVFVILIVIVIPLYYYTRPDASQPFGTLQIKGTVNNPSNLTYSELTYYQSVTQKVMISSSNYNTNDGNYTYTGISLKEILTRAQVSINATSVYIQASDGFGTTLTIQEAEKDDVFIAYLKEGKPLTILSDGGEGPFRLIISSDEFAQRWVRGVVSISVS